ncbi:MAG TPA: carboxypeptidase-like regulatory domain-containing protein [Longimicrobiaceae bacterium]|nr:carboxypeptidase-like regulatory domain-containing protein [Longimicrobiaceae bacterium]
MTVRTVRRFVLQPLFLLLAATAPAAAQGGAPNAVLAAQLRMAGLPPATLRHPALSGQDGTISLALDAVPLEAALLEIARKADLELTYSRESLVPGKRVSVHAASIEVDEAFARVLRGTGLEALRSGSGRVIIAPRAFEPVAPVFPEPILHVVGTVRTTPEIATLARYAEPGIVRGHVVEAGSLRPLSGVQVFIPQTALGAVTDAAGRYAIPNVPAGTHAVRATLLGYVDASTSVTVPSGEPAVADFTLSPAAVQLDALVVTGTPGATTRRQLGNAVTTVDAAQITRKMPVSNVQQLLQAQAPGVTVSNSAGIPGTAGTIRIRGQSSLSAGTEPVIYIDGVRVASGAAGSFRNDWQQSGPKAPSMTGPGGPAFGAGQEASALSMINPEDIQSI